MDRNSKAISLLYIGFGIGLILATFIFISWYLVYIDLASADEVIGNYIEYEYAIEDTNTEDVIIPSIDAEIASESTIVEIKNYIGIEDKNRTGDYEYED